MRATCTGSSGTGWYELAVVGRLGAAEQAARTRPRTRSRRRPAGTLAEGTTMLAGCGEPNVTDRHRPPAGTTDHPRKAVVSATTGGGPEVAGETMRAIVQHRYGTSDTWQLVDTHRPEIGADEVLVH